MRFFFLTYNDINNFDTTKKYNIAGTNNGNRGRFIDLQPDDIIIFRHISQQSKELNFLGHCKVVDTPFDQRNAENSNCPDFLWTTEIQASQIYFPYRVKVDFSHVSPMHSLKEINWKAFLSLEIKSKKGRLMDKQALGPFLRYNFLGEEYADKFKRLAKYSEPKKNLPDSVDTKRLKEIGDAGEKHIYEMLCDKYKDLNYKIIWTSRETPTSPYDLEVHHFDKTILYIEVKTTTRSFEEAVPLISINEVEWRSEHKDQHELYLVIYDGDLNSDPTVIKLDDNDFKLEPIKFKLTLRNEPN